MYNNINTPYTRINTPSPRVPAKKVRGGASRRGENGGEKWKGLERVIANGAPSHKRPLVRRARGTSVY